MNTADWCLPSQNMGHMDLEHIERLKWCFKAVLFCSFVF